MFGMHRVEDIKKEFYQLLNTTTDPNIASFYHLLICLRSIKIYYLIFRQRCYFVKIWKTIQILASSEYQQQQIAAAQRKRRAVGGGDSDSDEEAVPRASGIVRDIYRRRMNQKVHE